MNTTNIQSTQDNDDCNPPSTYGLSNSDVIIPSHYKLHKHPSKILEFDYYEVIKDDIRNCRPLNKYQLEYIKDLSPEYKIELLNFFNECIKTCYDILST